MLLGLYMHGIEILTRSWHFFCWEKEIMEESNIPTLWPPSPCKNHFPFRVVTYFLEVFEYIQSPYHSYLIGESSFRPEFYQDYKGDVFYNVISFPEAKLHIGSFSFSLSLFHFHCILLALLCHSALFAHLFYRR